MSKIRIAIIDDHEVVISGLRAMLASLDRYEIVFAGTDSQALLATIATLEADVVLLDIQMPGMHGIDLCKVLRKEVPSVRIIAFSSFDDTHYVRQVLRNGASGYVLKNAGQDTLLTAIDAVMKGEEFIDDIIKNLLIRENVTGQRRSIYEIPLTRRESEVLKLIAQELTNQEIADKLYLSLRTVETHRYNLIQKLGARNTAALVKEALRRGLID